jgi:hypothetical protein
MKRLLLFILSGLMLLPATTLFAYSVIYTSPFQITIVPPLGMNGRNARHYNNKFSLNLLVGVSHSENAVDIAGLGNYVGGHVDGVQVAGLGNYVGGQVNGVQIAGLGNYVEEDVYGVQFGGLGNYITWGDVYGLQFAGLGNNVWDVYGLQFAGLGNNVWDVYGLQFAGLCNISDDVYGLQFAGLGNISGNVDGLQFAGLFNKARYVSGAQFAGLVNIAKKSDYPVGIVNIIGDGDMGVGVGYNDLGSASLTFRSGGRVMYGIIGFGYNNKVEKSGDAVTVVAGYGAHVDINPWFRLNNELTFEAFNCFGNDKPDTFRTGYALLPAFRVAGNFELFGGPGINYLQTNSADMHNLFPKNSIWEKNRASGKKQQLYIGWQVGAQFIF